jgi:hypothetical protein
MSSAANILSQFTHHCFLLSFNMHSLDMFKSAPVMTTSSPHGSTLCQVFQGTEDISPTSEPGSMGRRGGCYSPISSQHILDLTEHTWRYSRVIPVVLIQRFQSRGEFWHDSRNPGTKWNGRTQRFDAVLPSSSAVTRSLTAATLDRFSHEVLLS